MCFRDAAEFLQSLDESSARQMDQVVTRSHNEHLCKGGEVLSGWALIGGIGPGAMIFSSSDPHALMPRSAPPSSFLAMERCVPAGDRKARRMRRLRSRGSASGS